MVDFRYVDGSSLPTYFREGLFPLVRHAFAQTKRLCKSSDFDDHWAQVRASYNPLDPSNCWLNIAEGHDDCPGAFAVRTPFKLNIQQYLQQAYVTPLHRLNIHSALCQQYTSTVLYCCRCIQLVLNTTVSSRSSKATSIYHLTQIDSMEFWMSSLCGFTPALQHDNKLLNTGQTGMACLVRSTQLLTAWMLLNSKEQPAVRLQSAEANLNCFGRGMKINTQSCGKMVSAQPLKISSYSSMRFVCVSLQGDIHHCTFCVCPLLICLCWIVFRALAHTAFDTRLLCKLQSKLSAC